MFARNGQPVSILGDYLEACGVNGVFATPQELADAAEATAGAVYSAYLDWEINKEGIKVRGMKNFPPVLDEAGTPTGEFQAFVNHPTLKNEDGSPKRLWANLRITNFISPRS